MKNNTSANLRLRNAVASILVLTAVGLLISGFVVNPAGKIDQSVLVALGESMTFGSAALGLHIRERKEQQKTAEKEKQEH